MFLARRTQFLTAFFSCRRESQVLEDLREEARHGIRIRFQRYIRQGRHGQADDDPVDEAPKLSESEDRVQYGRYQQVPYWHVSIGLVVWGSVDLGGGVWSSGYGITVPRLSHDCLAMSYDGTNGSPPVLW